MTGTVKNTNDEEKKGLNYYGISQLEGDNIEEFKRIILAIQNLFSIAPETIDRVSKSSREARKKDYLLWNII